MTRLIRRRDAQVVTVTRDGWDLDGLLYPAANQAGADTVLLHVRGKGRDARRPYAVDSDHWYHGFEGTATAFVRQFAIYNAGVDLAHSGTN